MLLGTITTEELENTYFFIECVKPPKSGGFKVGDQHRCDVEHRAGHVYFMTKNNKDEPFLVSLSDNSEEGVFEIVR